MNFVFYRNKTLLKAQKDVWPSATVLPAQMLFFGFLLRVHFIQFYDTMLKV